MPVIERSDYAPPPLLGNGHLQSILPTLLRRVPDVRYSRRRIDTPDGDFLDLDISSVGSTRLAILTHGLEGSSNSTYVQGMVRTLNMEGWDAVAWNCRSCSGELNRLPRFYHSGANEDLHRVIEYAISAFAPSTIALIGYSLGGNMTLKHLGDGRFPLHPLVRAAVTFSTPCDLRSSAHRLARPACWLYQRRFLASLMDKIRRKRAAMPADIPVFRPQLVRTLEDFDNQFTAPLHGFADAEDYWRQCSSRQFLGAVTLPTLLVNARNDPFLAEQSYPFEEARASSYLYFETPDSGGHVGFITFGQSGRYWSELRAMRFLRDVCGEC